MRGHEPACRPCGPRPEHPSGVGGLTDSILTPAYATGIGLLQWGASLLDEGEPTRYESAPAAGVLGRLRSAVKSMLP